MVLIWSGLGSGLASTAAKPSAASIFFATAASIQISSAASMARPNVVVSTRYVRSMIPLEKKLPT